MVPSLILSACATTLGSRFIYFPIQASDLLHSVGKIRLPLALLCHACHKSRGCSHVALLVGSVPLSGVYSGGEAPLSHLPQLSNRSQDPLGSPLDSSKMRQLLLLSYTF